LLLCGGLKIGYDIALLVVFKRQRNLDLDGDSSSG
jgi:hypothetical protein